MNERLKAIERSVIPIYEKPVNLVGYEISKGDYEWLIQQAKRANQLEYRVGLEERRSSNLSKQNQRYKQALKLIPEIIAYEEDERVIDEILKAIEQALKEESQ